VFVFIHKDIFEPDAPREMLCKRLHDAMHYARLDVSIAFVEQNLKPEDVEIAWNTNRFMVSVNGDLQGVIVELDDAV